MIKLILWRREVQTKGIQVTSWLLELRVSRGVKEVNFRTLLRYLNIFPDTSFLSSLKKLHCQMMEILLSVCIVSLGRIISLIISG